MSEEATLDEFTDSDEASQEEAQELFGLGQIPLDWEIKPLSDTAEIIPGNSPPSTTYNDDQDGLPFFQGNSNFGYFHPEADTWCSEPRKEAQPNDVLISIRAPVGDLNIADTKSCIGRGLAAVRPKEINGLYLYYNLGERKIWLSRLATGSTFKAINKSDLQLLDIPIPLLPEQRKIATVLYTVDRAIDKTKKVINQFDRLLTGTKQTLLRQGTNSDTLIQSTPTGRYPSNWELVRAGNFLELRNGEYLAKKERTENGNYPVYGGNGIMGHTDESIVGPETVVIGRVGAYCGNVHLTKEDAWVTDNAIILSELSDEYLPQFIVDLLDEIGLGQYSEQSAQPRISQSTVENLRIPKPPIDEQQEIINNLSSIRNAKDTEEAYKNQLKRLKCGLMQDLLSGTVRTTGTNIEVPEEIEQYG